MKLESLDFFYLSLPHVADIGDGSQDALLVRARAGGFEGWGECEASPLTSIAAYVAPMSHSACKPVSMMVEGETLNSKDDLRRIRRKVLENCLDLLQAPHTLSGIDIALWDLLGKKEQAPVYALLGYERAFPKTAYASMLFAATPEQTAAHVRSAVAQGFRAIKLGWGGYGVDVEQDAAQIAAARAAAGPDVRLMVDAGTIWTCADDPVTAAAQRLPALEAAGVIWLEEPFSSYDFSPYAALAKQCRRVRLAGGEGAHNPEMAFHMMEHAGLGYVQIDTGRIGGITPAYDVACRAASTGVQYVNHTFTSHLALSASLQPFAGLEHHDVCEYPFQPSDLTRELTPLSLHPDANGLVHVPETPGLGIAVHEQAIRKYLVPVRIEVNHTVLYQTPTV